jgi:hypothetical protein
MQVPTGTTAYGRNPLHAAGIARSLPSCSAARARQARSCSAVGAGKSERISPADIPAARHSNVSKPVVRMPRMHGSLLRLPGTIVIREWSDINNIRGRLVLLAVVNRAACHRRRLSLGFAADGRRALDTRVLNPVSDLPVEQTAAERDDRGACVVDVGPHTHYPYS